jgi:hypothetical protein
MSFSGTERNSSRCTAYDNETADLASGEGLSQDRICTENSLQSTAILQSCMENSVSLTGRCPGRMCVRENPHGKFRPVDCTILVMHGKFRVPLVEDFPRNFQFHLALHLIHKFHGGEFVTQI